MVWKSLSFLSLSVMHIHARNVYHHGHTHGHRQKSHTQGETIHKIDKKNHDKEYHVPQFYRYFNYDGDLAVQGDMDLDFLRYDNSVTLEYSLTGIDPDCAGPEEGDGLTLGDVCLRVCPDGSQTDINDKGGCDSGLLCLGQSGDQGTCDLIVTCQPALTCVVGQGQAGAELDQSSQNSKEGCEADCAGYHGCTNFDYTTDSILGSCRLYGPDNVPRLDDPGHNDWQYCTMRLTPEPISGNSCGYHIHEGRTCSADAGPHYYNRIVLGSDDPWSGVQYTAVGTSASGKENVKFDEPAASTVGRVVVIHNFDGERIACGFIKEKRVKGYGRHKEHHKKKSY